VSQPSPRARSGDPQTRARRMWACAGCLFGLALLLVLIGVVARLWLAPEDDTYQRDTDVSQTQQAEPSSEAEASPSPAPEGSLRLVSFVTPSGNIGCTFEDGTVGCSVRERDYPEDTDCSEDLFSVRLADGEVQPACGEDFTGEDPPELGYGQSAVSGTVACTSESDGLTCWDTETSTGFVLSRDSYETL